MNHSHRVTGIILIGILGVAALVSAKQARVAPGFIVSILGGLIAEYVYDKLT